MSKCWETTVGEGSVSAQARGRKGSVPLQNRKEARNWKEGREEEMRGKEPGHARACRAGFNSRSNRKPRRVVSKNDII